MPRRRFLGRGKKKRKEKQKHLTSVTEYVIIEKSADKKVTFKIQGEDYDKRKYGRYAYDYRGL